MPKTKGYLGKAVVLYGIGVIIMLFSQHLIQPFTDALDNLEVNTTFASYLWLGVILIWIMLCVVMPTFYTVELLRNTSENKSRGHIIIGVLVFIFGILITIKAWYMTDIIADNLTNDFALVLFWVGLITNWVMWVIITPYYLITSGFEA